MSPLLMHSFLLLKIFAASLLMQNAQVTANSLNLAHVSTKLSIMTMAAKTVVTPHIPDIKIASLPMLRITNEKKAPAPIVVEHAAVEIASNKAIASTTLPPPPQRICTFMTTSLELSAALRGLSDQTKVNLILLSTSDPKVSLEVRNRPLEEVVKVISLKAELDYLYQNESYYIGSKAQLEKLNAPQVSLQTAKVETPIKVSKYYRATYITSAEISRTLGELYPKDQLTIAIGPTSFGPESLVGGMSGASKSGADSSSSGGVPPSSGSSSILNSPSKTVILMGTADVVDQAIATIKSFDIARAQVSIQVTIADVDLDALKELGIDYNFSNLTFTDAPRSPLSIGNVTRSPFSITAVLHALETEGRTKILASPSVTSQDSVPATMLIGQRLLYPVLIGYTQNNAPIYDKAEVRVGIALDVTPMVGPDGMITLSIYPQVSSITGYLQVNGASYPQISTREAKTVVRVKSGSPIVIGGLIQEEEIHNLQKVPGLADIPILGELFKRHTTTKKSSHVVITITPTLLKD